MSQIVRHWKPKMISACLTLSLCLQSVGGAWAESDVVDISVGDWPPFIDERRPHNGIIAHLISEVFAEAGYTVRYHFRPWNRAYQEAATGQRDATAVWMHEPEREKDFHYSEPVLQEEFVFFHRTDHPFDWKNLDDLAGMHLGGGFGYSYGADFDEALKQGVFQQERVATHKQNFQRLLLSRIDLVPEEIHVGYNSLRRDLPPEQTEKITHHPKPFLKNQSYVLFPRASPESLKLMKLFNEHLRKFRKSGRYRSFFENFEAGLYDSPK